MTADRVRAYGMALRMFVREHGPMGQCKVLSKGDNCHCNLCMIDTLQELALQAVERDQ